MIETGGELAYQFFRDQLQMTWSEDFRGVLFTPIEFLGLPMKPEHVAVAVCWNHFNGKMCSMHTMIQKPEFVSRKMVRSVFEFPFEKCGLEHVIAPCPSSNLAAIDFDKRIGFKEMHRFEKAAMDGGDLVILGMSKAECRWLKGKKHE